MFGKLITSVLLFSLLLFTGCSDSTNKSKNLEGNSQSAAIVEQDKSETHENVSAKTEQPSNSIVNSSSTSQSDNGTKELINEPICFFSDTVTWGSGEEAFVEMWLVDGTYDSNPIVQTSVAWSGNAELRVSFEDTEPVVSNFYIYTSLEIDEFALYFNDYNGDGNPDFTYYNGWCNSSHGYFHIYTILPDGSIALLPVAQYMDDDFFTGCGALDSPSSVPLHKEGNGFYAVYYYNGGGPDAKFGHVKHLFQWIDGQFVPSGEEIEIDRDEASSMIYPNR